MTERGGGQGSRARQATPTLGVVVALAATLLLGGWVGCLAQTLTTGQIAGLQVGLDRQGFSPGVIDGKLGAQTRAALAAWQTARHQPPTGEPGLAEVGTLMPRDGWSTNYIITAQDMAELGESPQDWLARSRVPRMAFESLQELVAERFHAKESFLAALNPAITNWAAVGLGASLVVPNPVGPALPAAARLEVSLTGKSLRAYDAAGQLIAQFPCSIAAHKENRPVGTLTVQAMAADPNYTFDPATFPELDETQRGYGKLIIPPGPNNPVGTAWISLSLPGYGIHGTPHPDQIGKTESHGCFRLANWNAERLLKMVVVGTPVEVSAE